MVSQASKLRSQGIDKERADNLRTLAKYLLTLPPEYPDFAMANFVNDDELSAGYAFVPECGTAACAVGHGPAAGFAPNGSETWTGYSMRLFVKDWFKPAWEWCFGSEWSNIDNTAHGAAARILHLLDEGLPDDWSEQMQGEAGLSYSRPTVSA